MSDEVNWTKVMFPKESIGAVNFGAQWFMMRWLALAFGVPIHILVASVILRTRQLHNPRNTFWLGNITCHLATLLMGAFEYLATSTESHQKKIFLCRIYTLLVGSPYTNLLVSLLLATADRWVAISYPLYHRKHITVCKVAVFLVASWILVLATLTSPYWSGRIQIPFCSVHPDVMMWVTLGHFVLVVFIIVAQVKVYIRAREYFKFRASHQLSMVQIGLEQQNSPAIQLGCSGSSSNNTLKPDEYFVHLPDKTISRLELEASVTLWCGVATLCFFTLPLACLFLAIFICRATAQPWCDDVVELIPYARELFLLHAVVSPLLYIFRSREFSSAFRRMLPSCFIWRHRGNEQPVQLF